ncbi:MAG: PilZ domain-containing protein [Acidobacteriota bacterium]|nr:PilZ domain-containing protein [Acidobacteriota bacterium]
MIEKRSTPRLMKQTLLSYDVMRDGREIFDDGMAKTLDMSPRGLHLELPKTVDRGDDLTITLNLDGQMVTVSGKVMWVSHGKSFDRAGVQVKPGQNHYLKWLNKLPVND